MRLLAALVLLAAPAHAQYFGPDDLIALPSTPPTVVSTYGRDPAQVVDLRLPAGKGPFPVVVVVHGGCFIAQMADRNNLAAIASDLPRHGVATLNVEYRRLGNGGGWPATFLDVGSGIDKLRELAKSHPLDLSRVVVIGHSAGAPLAAWVAARPRLPKGSPIRGDDPLPVRAAIPVDGPVDLARWGAGADAEVCGRPVIAPLLGARPDKEPARYAEASPIQRIPLGVPLTIVTSEIVTEREANDYAGKARAAGDTVTVIALNGRANHFEPMGPGRPGYEDVLRAIVSAVKPQ